MNISSFDKYNSGGKNFSPYSYSSNSEKIITVFLMVSKPVEQASQLKLIH